MSRWCPHSIRIYSTAPAYHFDIFCWLPSDHPGMCHDHLEDIRWYHPSGDGEAELVLAALAGTPPATFNLQVRGVWRMVRAHLMPDTRHPH